MESTTYEEAERSYLDYIRATAREEARRAIESRIRLHIRPALKGKRIPLTVQEEIDLKEQINEKPISKGHKRIIWNTYAQIVNHARRALGIEGARVKTKGFPRPRHIYTIWTREDFETFERELKKPLERLFFRLLFYSGARRGEILALRPESLMGHQRIAITATYSRNKLEEHTKTSAGTRRIKIPQDIYEELERQAGKTKAGGRIFEALKYTTLERRVRQICEKTGLKRPRLHDFRHSHITMLLHEGFTPQGVARRAGHSNTEILLNTYASYIDREEDEIAERLEAIEKGAPGRDAIEAKSGGDDGSRTRVQTRFSSESYSLSRD